MNIPCKMLQEFVGGSKLQFAFYTSAGELFAYGNSQKMSFYEKLGLDAEYFGKLPKMLPLEELENPDNTGAMTRFLISLCELEGAYTYIRELENQLEENQLEEEWL